MNNILVICVGNICRSPTAEFILKNRFPHRQIWSAGLGALVGRPADPLAVEVGLENGLDMSAHRAQQVASWMCQSADLILVMESGHKSELEKLYPLVRGKVFRLGETRKIDIADPYRHPKVAFSTAFNEISLCIDEWANRLRRLA